MVVVAGAAVVLGEVEGVTALLTLLLLLLLLEDDGAEELALGTLLLLLALLLGTLLLMLTGAETADELGTGNEETAAELAEDEVGTAEPEAAGGVSVSASPRPRSPPPWGERLRITRFNSPWPLRTA